jgi:pre-mRNA-splicing factor ATP-dependent RNA helicase DHX15/PRP43
MARRKLEDDESPPAKRHKNSSPTEMDPRTNPYLAHRYEDAALDETSYANGYDGGRNRTNGISLGTSLAKFPRHATTTAMANKAEDGPNNPFTAKPFSQQYFNILKTRRNLPVHAQR